MQKSLLKSTAVMAYLGCASIFVVTNSLNAEQVAFNKKPIFIGSYTREFGFAPQVTGKVLCDTLFSSTCEISAVVELERELKARQKFDLAVFKATKKVPLIVSGFARPEPKILPVGNLFSQSAFDLKIPTSKAVATVLRTQEEKTKSDTSAEFNFSSSYAFLNEAD